MKIKLLFCLLFFSSMAITAQNNTFFRKYNLSGMQGGLAVAAMPDGGFVGTGQHENNGSAGSCDIYVYRVDVCGNLLWMKLIGGNQADGGQGIFVTNNGNIVVLGRLDEKASMIEISQNGTVLSTKLFDFNGRLMGGTELPNGDYSLNGPGGSNSLYVLRYEPSNGSVLWTRKTSGADASKVIQDSTGHIFLGAASGSDGALTIHKITQSGDLIWAKKYGSSITHSDHSSWGCHIIYDEQDSTIVGTSTIIDGGSQNILLLKVKASDGSVVWSKSIGGASADQSRMIVNTGDGYAIVGHSSSYATTTSNLNITLDENLSEKDVLLFKTDFSGNILWARQYGSSGRDKGIGLQYDTISKGFLISAYSNGNYFDSYNFDPVFIRVDSTGLIGCQSSAPSLGSSAFSVSISNSSLDSAFMTVNNASPTISNYTPIDDFVCLTCSTTPLFTISDTVICPNDSINLINTSTSGLTCFQEWNVSGQNFPGYLDTIKYSWDTPGTYEIDLYSNCGNSSDTFTYNISVVDRPEIVTDSLIESCEGDSVILFASGIQGNGDYFWSNGVNNGDYFVPSLSGDSIWVYGVDNNGCKDTTYTRVFFTEIQGEAFSTPVCEDDTATFIVSSNIQYGLFDNISIIAPDTTVSNLQDSVINIVFNDPGDYLIPIIIETDKGCRLEIRDTIKIYGKPDIRAEVVDSIVSEFSAYIRTLNFSDSVNSFKWDFGDGSGTKAVYNPIGHQYPLRLPKSYTITIQAESPKGCIDYDSLTVKIKEELIYHIPNSFSPNNDGINDLYKPIFYSGYDPSYLEFKIFDRWGSEMFSTQNFGDGWDGKCQGVDAKTDTYLYSIIFRSKEDGEVIIERGRLNLLR